MNNQDKQLIYKCASDSLYLMGNNGMGNLFYNDLCNLVESDYGDTIIRDIEDAYNLKMVRVKDNNDDILVVRRDSCRQGEGNVFTAYKIENNGDLSTISNPNKYKVVSNYMKNNFDYCLHNPDNCRMLSNVCFYNYYNFDDVVQEQLRQEREQVLYSQQQQILAEKKEFERYDNFSSIPTRNFDTTENTLGTINNFSNNGGNVGISYNNLKQAISNHFGIDLSNRIDCEDFKNVDFKAYMDYTSRLYAMEMNNQPHISKQQLEINLAALDSKILYNRFNENANEYEKNYNHRSIDCKAFCESIATIRESLVAGRDIDLDHISIGFDKVNDSSLANYSFYIMEGTNEDVNIHKIDVNERQLGVFDRQIDTISKNANDFEDFYGKVHGFTSLYKDVETKESLINPYIRAEGDTIFVSDRYIDNYPFINANVFNSNNEQKYKQMYENFSNGSINSKDIEQDRSVDNNVKYECQKLANMDKEKNNNFYF